LGLACHYVLSVILDTAIILAVHCVCAGLKSVSRITMCGLLHLRTLRTAPPQRLAAADGTFLAYPVS
jgi:hypothetical protein